MKAKFEPPHEIKSISVAGQGEPLCNPRLADMIKVLKEADVAEDVSFITNGLLFTKKEMQAISIKDVFLQNTQVPEVRTDPTTPALRQ